MVSWSQIIAPGWEYLKGIQPLSNGTYQHMCYSIFCCIHDYQAKLINKTTIFVWFSLDKMSRYAFQLFMAHTGIRGGHGFESH